MKKTSFSTYAFAVAAVAVTATAVTSGIDSRLKATAPFETENASEAAPDPTSSVAPTSASTPGPTTPTVAQAPAEDIGMAEFGNCSGCHGESAQGIDEAFAPALAGSDGEYLLRQLVNFRTGLRGAAEEDEQGQLMSSIASALPEESMEPLVAYIQTLPVEARPNLADRPLPDIIADVVPTCAGCHGENGEGVADVQAPPLTHLAPFYIEEQLSKFASGLRGSHPDDGPGLVMASMAEMYSDEQVRAALAEYYGQQ